MDLFDFDNTTDLPEALASGVATSAGEPAGVGTLVDLLGKAPRPLSLAEIAVVWFRSQGSEAVKTTLRSYLNRAVADGRLVKPTNRTYAIAGSVEEVSEAVEEVATDEVAETTDLADELANL